jgi:hypothetical protein
MNADFGYSDGAVARKLTKKSVARTRSLAAGTSTIAAIRPYA